MDQTQIFLTICGMGAVTYLPRVLPMLILSGRTLPHWLVRWLSYLPATVLAALLIPSLLCRNAELSITADNLYLLAAIPTVIVAWRGRSFFGTIAFGMVLVALLRYLL
ncbi:MAG: AzlD domain-containing protein [Desulfofustis sp. PB-SRB1]|jgi:branched-subunit amino acid transport protein|nr:AzlD domain-containing protein [Desulfofustis sp. PB-SRB1]MBM1004180.1 AzlD domain-containing protein [Desulfofustis sp. PB-SRB1]HBH27795.1 AzlD domain-containing protein [Desulfofustis sp.]